MNLKEIKELIKMLDETDISELNLESEGVKICIRKGLVATAVAPAVSVAPVAAQAPAAKAEAVPTAPAARADNVVEITAPMVGTFYRTPSPEAAPFVQVGDIVSKGQAVCIIEAMKLMNEIEAEVGGRIIEVLVENGQPVEYGQPLFLVEK